MISLTEEGTEHVERLLENAGLLQGSNLYDIENTQVVHHVNQALKAIVMFRRDTDYIVKDGKVVIIDEFTGRMMDGRRWSDGLHQAVEAKEGVKIEPENQTMASITFQNFFRMYPKLSGMTGTAATEAAEFWDIYKMNVVEIPTNVPVQRIDEDDEFYKNTLDKFQAIAKAIKEKRAGNRTSFVGGYCILQGKSSKGIQRLSRTCPHLTMMDGTIDVFVWEDKMESTKDLWEEGKLVAVAGTVRFREDDVSISCQKAEEYVPEDAETSATTTSNENVEKNVKIKKRERER